MNIEDAKTFMKTRANRLQWYGEATGIDISENPVVQIGYHDGFLYVLEWNNICERPEDYVSAYNVQNFYGEVEFDTTIEDAEKKMPRLNWRSKKPLPNKTLV
tara:strand:+ start:238 stop:543 length:306 start_codon:yes stop_codon:yes gene_type:complete